MKSKERKNVEKIKALIDKNRHNISRIVVSEEFMLMLQEYADLVEIEERRLKMSVEHSFNDIDHSGEDYIDVTYLFKVPCFMSAHIMHGAVLEMNDGEFFVLKNV